MLERPAKNSSAPRVVMHTSEPSGLGHYVSKLVLALAKSSVPIVLFCPANSSDKDEVIAVGVEVAHAAPRETTYAGPAKRLLRNFVFLAKSLRTQARLVRPGDIVHFQGMLHLPLGFAFLLQAKLCGAKLVLTAHDPLPHRWRFPRPMRWLERGMLHLSYRLFDAIIVHNQTGRNTLLGEFQLHQERVFVIPHGWYMDAADADSAYPAFDCLRLLAFGSIRENKGLHLSIQAVQALIRSRVPVRLTITGVPQNADEERYRQACEQLIAANPDGIEVIVRHIADDEVGALLARHHAVLLPYTNFFSESGVANLALSHQRPIFATTAGGLGELIEQCGCGIAIAEPSAESVAAAISKAIQLGQDKLRKMGIEGNEFIRKTRSWDTIAHQTADLYSSLLPNKAALNSTSLVQPYRHGLHPATTAKSGSPLRDN